MITVLRWLLLPLSFVYQFIVWLRNRMYDLNILKSQSFSTPTIVVGNLAVGGAGKSPMTAYLIKLLKNKYNIATLSRGYGRKTKGFKYVNLDSKAIEVGDEPLQFKKNFPDITVSVCEDRCFGVKHLENSNDLIILDDAFQHRRLNAGFYLLLFDFKSLLGNRLTLPTGNFRDNFSSTKRADLIVITKCPDNILPKHKEKIELIIRKYSSSPIVYSSIEYNTPISFNKDTNSIEELTDYDIVLFCGIANPSPLIQYLEANNNRITLIQFPDHHNYSSSDFDKIISSYKKLNSDNKIILTTEKDIQRISNNSFCNYPLYYIPISFKTQDETIDLLGDIIESYIEKNI